MKSKKLLFVFVSFFMFANILFAASNKEMPVVHTDADFVYLSPNDDGIQDTGVISFSVEIVVKSEAGYVPEYGFTIKDEDGETVKEYSEQDENDLSKFIAFFRRYEKFKLERKIFWDGKDNEGNIVEDGDYEVTIWVIDSSKNKSELRAGVFVVDNTPPSVEIEVPENNVFSPNFDGRLDTFPIVQTGTKEQLWKAFIRNENGEVVRSYRFIDSEPELIQWDGTDDRLMAVADGIYTYEIMSEDQAGNKSELVVLENIVKDTTATEVTAIYYNQGFAPEGEGDNNTLEIKLFHEYEQNYSTWQYNLKDVETEEIVLEVSGDNELPGLITLDGMNKEGNYLAEGAYEFEYFVNYNHGNRPTIKDIFYIDNTPPELELTSRANPFIKTAKGDADGEVFITVDVEDNIGVDIWSLEITDSEGNIVRAYSGKGNPSAYISWDATTDDGSNVQADNVENLTMKLEVTDFAGNIAVFEKPVGLELLVVEKDGKLYLMVPNIVFGAYKYEIDSLSRGQAQDNVLSIDRVADIYKKYPGFMLELEGHALNIYSAGSEEWDDEELVLMPLTENRSNTVKEHLIKRGVLEKDIITSAFGGRYPVVSTTDPSVWWKNRRVEFIMQKIIDPSDYMDILEGYSSESESESESEELDIIEE